MFQLTQIYCHFARAERWRGAVNVIDIFRILTKISLFWLCKHNLNPECSGLFIFDMTIVSVYDESVR